MLDIADTNFTGLNGAKTLLSKTSAAVVTTYDITTYMNVTADATDVLSINITYTDENSNSTTITQNLQPHGGGWVTVTTAGVTDNFSGAVTEIRAKASTTISVATILSVGGGTTTYDAGAHIVRVSGR
jgi:hypothetical protein